MSFANGQPVEPADSTTATRDILSNADLSACPGSCFRPAGLAMDSKGRIFMSSDATGEIYVLQKGEMTILGGPTTTSSGGGTLVTSTDQPQGGQNLAPRSLGGWTNVWAAAGAAALAVLGMFVVAA
jgi:hypothetical protein